jgi:hypothetical protein
MKHFRKIRANNNATSSSSIGGQFEIHLPWEKAVNDVLKKAEHAVSGIFHEACSDAGGALGAAAYGVTEVGNSLSGGTPAETYAGKGLLGIGRVVAVLGVGFYAAHRIGVC